MTSSPQGVPLGEKFTIALGYASKLHRTQFRKGTEIPYISHLLAVCAHVIEAGGDEEQAIAALLHDAAEDRGGQETLDEISDKFGQRVADMVEHYSDTFEDPKPPWRKRKEDYLEHLKTVPEDALLISMADKLHNSSAIVEDLKVQGEKLWERFTGKKEGTLWYYRALSDVYAERSSLPIVRRIRECVDNMEKLA